MGGVEAEGTEMDGRAWERMGAELMLVFSQRVDGVGVTTEAKGVKGVEIAEGLV